MGRIGIGELIVIAIIFILLFGASRLADIGKGLGDGIRNLKKGLREAADDDPAKAQPTSNAAANKSPETSSSGTAPSA
jgi:sec-independent protein translocase protein TatA